MERSDRIRRQRQKTLGTKGYRKKLKKEGAPHRYRPPTASSGGSGVNRKAEGRTFWAAHLNKNSCDEL
jgi:hypothetical protein